MSAKKTPLTKEIPLEKGIIAWKNQLTLLEDNVGDVRKDIFKQMSKVILGMDRQSRKLFEEKQQLEEEVDRLGRILKEHNIDSKPPKKFKNRREKRAESQKSTKIN